MVTSTLNPEFARTSGAILNAIMKSGTNAFHGDAFDFYRDTFLNARNYVATAPQPYQQNTFGATLGGPVIKNHTFFFFSYQGIRAVQPQTNPIGPTVVTNVYSAAQLKAISAQALSLVLQSSPRFPCLEIRVPQAARAVLPEHPTTFCSPAVTFPLRTSTPCRTRSSRSMFLRQTLAATNSASTLSQPTVGHESVSAED